MYDYGSVMLPEIAVFCCILNEVILSEFPKPLKKPIRGWSCLNGAVVGSFLPESQNTCKIVALILVQWCGCEYQFHFHLLDCVNFGIFYLVMWCFMLPAAVAAPPATAHGRALRTQVLYSGR